MPPHTETALSANALPAREAADGLVPESAEVRGLKEAISQMLKALEPFSDHATAIAAAEKDIDQLREIETPSSDLDPVQRYVHAGKLSVAEGRLARTRSKLDVRLARIHGEVSHAVDNYRAKLGSHIDSQGIDKDTGSHFEEALTGSQEIIALIAHPLRHTGSQMEEAANIFRDSLTEIRDGKKAAARADSKSSPEPALARPETRPGVNLSQPLEEELRGMEVADLMLRGVRAGLQRTMRGTIEAVTSFVKELQAARLRSGLEAGSASVGGVSIGGGTDMDASQLAAILSALAGQADILDRNLTIFSANCNSMQKSVAGRLSSGTAPTPQHTISGQTYQADPMDIS